MKVARSAFENKGKLPPSRKAGHFLNYKNRRLFSPPQIWICSLCLVYNVLYLCGDYG